MGKMNILHLSDLHIKNTFDSSLRLANNIGDSLYRYDEIINVVVVTGDIFYKPSKNTEEANINEAVAFFNNLLEKINNINTIHGQEPLRKEDILFVSGNHDLYMDETYGHWSLYDKFLEKFYGDDMPEQYNSNHMLIKPYPEKEVLFLGFDSNIDLGKKGKNKFTGHITSEHLDLADKFLQKGNGYPEYDIIALFHHPCYLFEETGTRDTEGIINNALEVLNKLAMWDVKLVLHGHKHDERQCVYRPIIGQKIYMFATNTIGANGSANHSGNIIELGKKIKLKRIIAKNNSSFSVEEINIRDNYEEGLLYNLIKKSDGHDDDYDNVVQMICELYLSNKPLKLLLYNPGNRFILKNSLKYKLDPAYAYDESHEGISVEELLEIKSILDSNAEIPEKTKDNLQNDLGKKRRMAFALLADFFVDLYKRIDDAHFVKLEDKQFNIDTSCYYVYFALRSSAEEANAYKELDDIMEEFQVRLDEIQDFLYCIKLNIKNIFLELQGIHINDKRYCNFDASVPRLIQLLTGSNIYYHDYTFVRELIQNSIDAISFREKQDEKKFAPCICIAIEHDRDNNAFLKIRDSGIGMRREIIERYFTTLGRSFYKEYTGIRNIQYNSISNFGIGFLAVFKPCKKIIINTKHYKEMIHHQLEINSNKGHFTICSNSHTGFDVGTEITCYLEREVNFKEIINYIRKIMLDIKYDVLIKADKLDISQIEARAIRKSNDIVIFIPFNEDDKEGSNDYLNKTLEERMEYYRHGFLIRPELPEKAGMDILSAGIKLQDAKLEDVFGRYDIIPKDNPELKFIKATMNFPPNWLDIDVSREKTNGIRERYITNVTTFKEYIYNGLKHQVQKAVIEQNDLKISFFSDALTLMKYFQPSDDENNELETLALEIQFTKGWINFKLGDNKEILSHMGKIDINLRLADDESKRVHNTIIDLFNEGLSHDEVSAILQMSAGSENLEKGKQILQKLGLILDYVDDKYLPIISALFMEEKKESQEKDGVGKDLRTLVVETILNNCTVGEIGKESLFSIVYDDFGHPELTMKSNKLDRIIELIAPVYGERSDVYKYKYDFIWTHIIEETQSDYFFHFNEGEAPQINNSIKDEYLSLNRKTKNLYLSSNNSLIDRYTIAACYMGALLSIPDAKIEWPENRDPLTKYYWILDVGLQLIYIWGLSEYIEAHEGICNTPLKKGKFEFPYGDKSREKYAKLLASQEKKTFDVLCFAELLHWVDIYNEGKIIFDYS